MQILAGTNGRLRHVGEPQTGSTLSLIFCKTEVRHRERIAAVIEACDEVVSAIAVTEPYSGLSKSNRAQWN